MFSFPNHSFPNHSFPNHSFPKSKSLQNYMNDSLNKSIHRKITSKKNSTYFIKYPVICELNYLNCDFDWSKKELFKYLNFSKEYFYKLKHKSLGEKKETYKDLEFENKKKDFNFLNKNSWPFFIYFAFTSSFFILEQTFLKINF